MQQLKNAKPLTESGACAGLASLACCKEAGLWRTGRDGTPGASMGAKRPATSRPPQSPSSSSIGYNRLLPCGCAVVAPPNAAGVPPLAAPERGCGIAEEELPGAPGVELWRAKRVPRCPNGRASSRLHQRLLFAASFPAFPSAGLASGPLPPVLLGLATTTAPLPVPAGTSIPPGVPPTAPGHPVHPWYTTAHPATAHPAAVYPAPTPGFPG